MSQLQFTKADHQSTLIIGGGFYGLSIALFLRDELNMRDILVIDKEPTMMSRASYVNQARVHNGYHYPRSVLTGFRSAINFPRFVQEYQEAIVDDFDKYYGISRTLSKVNAHQFKNFVEKIEACIEEPTDEIASLFSEHMVEHVYKVQEYAFNSHTLRDLLLHRIAQKPGITVHNNEEVRHIEQVDDNLVKVVSSKGEYIADKVINCAYSQINTVHRNSEIPLVALKHEITEMCLVKLPDELQKFSITMMDGPFFSIMPFPTRGLHTLSHVRYTPHASWLDDENTQPSKHDVHKYFAGLKFNSNYKKMYADVVRYIPALKDMQHVDSITEVKTVLQKSEGDDSRPILFKPHFGIHNYTCIMGGKLDNIYDAFDELRGLYEKAQ